MFNENIDLASVLRGKKPLLFFLIQIYFAIKLAIDVTLSVLSVFINKCATHNLTKDMALFL